VCFQPNLYQTLKVLTHSPGHYPENQAFDVDEDTEAGRGEVGVTESGELPNIILCEYKGAGTGSSGFSCENGTPNG
jgi:hypothetical protein